MQAVPTLRLGAVVVEFLVAGDAPHVRGHAIFGFENLLGAQCFVQDGAAAEQLGAQFGFAIRRLPEAVHPAKNAVLHLARHSRHGVRFVHHRQIIENAFAVSVHAANAVLNDDGNFVGKRGVVSLEVGNGKRQNVAVAVLVLQAFAGKRGASCRAAEQKPPCAQVRRSPDEVRDSLEAEHRVIDKERNRVDPVRGVGRTRSNERGHRACLGDAFFENLSVLRFLVIQQRVHIHGLVALAHAGINAHGAE